MQKARGQAFWTEVQHSPPTACRHTVSGTISLPSQGCFSPFPHGTGSLSVAREYLALRDGPRRFPQDFSCPAVLRYLSSKPADCRLLGYHRLWQAFPDLSTRPLVFYLPALRPNRPYNPVVHARRFGLFRVRSPLLAESLTCFLLLEVLRWFTSLRCLPQPMYSAEDPPVLAEGGYPIRESPGQSLFAAHRGFSQLTTPFIDF
jgi:hypothetical protein